MKTFPIAIASAVLGLSLVAGGLRTATAEEGSAGPGDTCTVFETFCVSGSQIWENCPTHWEPGMAMPIRWAETYCRPQGSSGNP